MRFLVLLLFVILVGAFPAKAQDAVGAVTRIEGSATAGNRTLSASAPLYAQDHIATGKDSRLELRFTDGTVVTLGDDSAFAIEDYAYTTDAGTSRFAVTAGVFKAASGAIASLAHGSGMVVRTPAATIGVRGTGFWGHVVPERLEVALIEGHAITVETPQGRVELNQIGIGTDVQAGNAPDAPHFWSAERLAAATATVMFH